MPGEVDARVKLPPLKTSPARICDCAFPRGATKLFDRCWHCMGCGGIRLDMICKEEVQRDMLARLNAWERHYGLSVTGPEVFQPTPRGRRGKVRRVRRRRRRHRPAGESL